MIKLVHERKEQLRVQQDISSWATCSGADLDFDDDDTRGLSVSKKRRRVDRVGGITEKKISPSMRVSHTLLMQDATQQEHRISSSPEYWSPPSSTQPKDDDLRYKFQHPPVRVAGTHHTH